MHLSKPVGAVLVITILVSGSADAMSQKGKPQVRFVAVGPMGMKIEGKSDSLAVKDDGARLSVVVPLAALQTGIGLRDRHMRDEYLETAKFPNARLVVNLAALVVPKGSKHVETAAHGKLTLHGQTHSVTFHYRAVANGKTVNVSGDLHLEMTDYGIHVPTYLGVTVKPGVDVGVQFKVEL